MDEDDVEASEQLLQLFMLAFAFDFLIPQTRQSAIYEQRLAWDAHCDKHTRRGTFKRQLRMKKQSFDKLLSYVREDLTVDLRQACRRGGPIIPELCLHMTLRWLAGGSHLDICDIAGVAQASFYRVIWKTIVALVLCPELAIKFPKTAHEIEKAMSGFASISTETAIKNCVGVIDGYLLRTRVPSKKEAGNVRAFFSGHYQCYGVNVQGIADHHSRFICFFMASPGVTDDRDAVRHCGVGDLIESLPFGTCVIGDSAYAATEHLVPICQGLEKLEPHKDNFNFCGSQCRIRIEMAFGIMQMKWGILQRPLVCSLRNTKWLAQAIARLHNFVINERLANKEDPVEEVRETVEEGRLSYHPTVPHDNDGNPVSLQTLFKGTIEGHSHLREAMVKRVRDLQLLRPAANKRQRNRCEGEAVTEEAAFPFE